MQRHVFQHSCPQYFINNINRHTHYCSTFPSVDILYGGWRNNVKQYYSNIMVARLIVYNSYLKKVSVSLWNAFCGGKERKKEKKTHRPCICFNCLLLSLGWFTGACYFERGWTYMPSLFSHNIWPGRCSALLYSLQWEVLFGLSGCLVHWVGFPTPADDGSLPHTCAFPAGGFLG